MMQIIFKIFKSLILTVLTFAVAVGIGYFIYGATILIWNPHEKIEKHDAIVVLTGEAGRIEAGFELLLDNLAPKILITGVRPNVSFESLIEKNSTTLSGKQKDALLNHCCIDIDYVADTTETNAIETIKWINDNNITSFILVTSASHMPRAFLQFDKRIDKTIKITPYPYHRQSRMDLVFSESFWKYVGREYLKFGGSLIRLESL